MADASPRVSFYVLKDVDPSSRLGYACRLIEKAYKLSHRVHVHAGDEATARKLDDLLWTFRQGSFVPHAPWIPGTPPSVPVTIGAGDDAPDGDLLVNLAGEAPSFYSRYARIAEIVDASPEGRESGRARHRFYRTQGLQPETHEVS